MRAPASSTRPPTSHAVALWCAEQGWPVHPLAPGRKTPPANCPSCKDKQHAPKDCACLSAGRPCHGFHAATTNTTTINAWWSAHPSWGVGVACGGADLIVIDVDAHSAPVPDRSRLLPGIPIHDSVNLQGLVSGYDTLALLAALRSQQTPAEDKSTLRVRTPSGGLHIWYRNPYPAARVRCSTGSSPKVALAWQVDIRADGGYIVAPTTRTSQGTYVPEGPSRLPAPLPEWLGEELVRTGHMIKPALASSKRVISPRRSRTAVSGRRILDPLLLNVAQCALTPEGASFTEKLNRAAYTAGGLCAAGHLDELPIRAELRETADSARPWQTARNERIIDSAFSAGSAHPLRIEGRS
ncbi:bifunctional DNA primase/polymerase [Streptomyces sp. NPDC001185]|uniref:bifunctional DNA primase/polymerase n=1 Tax=Streptomyces sp. NPDC001185 TaxID=3154380 RepID=UPI003327E947